MVSGARSGTHRSGGSGIRYSAELFRDGVVDGIFYYNGEPTTASASTAIWATISSALTASSSVRASST